jgi:hypothetical protein
MAEHSFQPVDLSRIHTSNLQQRGGLVHADQFARLTEKGCSFVQWLEALPGFLGAKDLKGLAQAILAARRAGRPVIGAMGGHVVKVGCGPIICDLMHRQIITAVAMNGATATHDIEIALCGQTSEDVGKALAQGVFGMAKETADVFAEAVTRARTNAAGLGGSIGSILMESKASHADLSILATAARLKVPATIHVALGTDAVNMHPNIDAGLLGHASLWDFRLLCSIVADLASDRNGVPEGADPVSGGVWVNIGSAVILPEVFLKTLAVARNLGINLDGLVTANLDMMRHYRTRQNVLNRPIRGGGRSFELIGQHEILLPLLRQAIVELGS